MTIENFNDVAFAMQSVTDFLSTQINDDEYNAMYDEMYSKIADILYMSRRVKNFDAKRKETNELFMYKVTYKRDTYTNNFYLDFETVFSINEFTHNYHIYEVITKRKFEFKKYDEINDYDYITKTLVICDFDRANCYTKDTVEQFDEELISTTFDVRFDNIEYFVKQIS